MIMRLALEIHAKDDLMVGIQDFFKKEKGNSSFMETLNNIVSIKILMPCCLELNCRQNRWEIAINRV